MEDAISIARDHVAAMNELREEVNELRAEVVALKMDPILAHARMRVRSAYIIKIVAKEHRIPIEHLLGHRRTKDLCLSRSMAIYLVRQFTCLSWNQIAKMFDDRDHSTMLSAIRKLDEQRKDDAAVDSELCRLEHLLAERAA